MQGIGLPFSLKNNYALNIRFLFARLSPPTLAIINGSSKKVAGDPLLKTKGCPYQYQA